MDEQAARAELATTTPDKSWDDFQEWAAKRTATYEKDGQVHYYGWDLFLFSRRMSAARR